MRQRLNLARIVLMLAILLVTVGCQQVVPSPSPAPEKITVTDDFGRMVTIEGKVERIISLAPPNTEILFALGLGERMVGVTKYCNYPPEAAEIEKMGTVRELNYETIVELAPDLVLAGGHTSQEAIAKLEELGLTVLVLDPEDIDAIFANIELVGQATGAEEQAHKLVAELGERRDSLLAKTEGVSHKPIVYLEIDPNLYTAGPGSFIATLINMAGGTNIAADSGEPYPQFSAEEIIERDPEVIILADVDLGVDAEVVKARPGWEGITAVKNDSIQVIDRDIISRAGPRIIDGLEELVKIIHPELLD